jgi:hypothetical protein
MHDSPEWLGRDLVAGALPWEQGLPTSVATFLDRFTLQDSIWLGLYSELAQHATLLLQWDPLQSEGGAPFALGSPEAGLLLAIRFDAMERAEVKLRHRRIASAVSGAKSRCADLHRTHLEDRRGGNATLHHAPNVRFLCLTHERTVFALPVAAETL